MMIVMTMIITIMPEMIMIDDGGDADDDEDEGPMLKSTDFP